MKLGKLKLNVDTLLVRGEASNDSQKNIIGFDWELGKNVWKAKQGMQKNNVESNVLRFTTMFIVTLFTFTVTS